MMSSVADRTVEIATLRAIGFGRLPTFLATWAEAALLMLAGIVLGIGLSWLIFDGWQASTQGAANTRIGFHLVVTTAVTLAAGLLGLMTGLLGGALPAIVASRSPLTAALRAQV